MKRFLATATLAFTLTGLISTSWADEADSSGRVRLTDESSGPPPIPSVIGEGDGSGRAVLGGGPTGLPEPTPEFMETMNAPNIGYRMGGDIFTVQYRIDQRNGGLYGYDDGYTNIGAFIPRAIDDNSLLFWDLRGLATNNSDGGFNFGFGRRRYSPSGDAVYSQSMWLDYDGGHAKQYLQTGYSWSMTSRYWRSRFNYNHLISDQDDFVGSTVYPTATGATLPTAFYTGNELHIGRERTLEAAFNHLDATIGGPIPLLGQYGMNWDFGLSYDYSRKGQNGIGFIANAEANLSEDIQANVRYTNNDIWGSNAQLSFVFNLPDGRPSRLMRQPRVHDYMLRPDERNYRVSTKRYIIEDSLPLLCATNGAPLNIAHIAPFEVDGVVPAGDGSFETPFNSTAAWNALTGAEKAAFDIVLVQPGITPAGTTFDNNLNTGIVIVENQRLLASTGRFERLVDQNGSELIRIAPHMVTADIAGYGTGLTYSLPGPRDEDTALYGTIFDPLVDERPILTNNTSVVSTRPHSVVTIDNSFSVACDAVTEVSGFIIDGNNPNMPTMLNNGIVTGNILDPALGTGVTNFDINSNFILDTVHGVHISHTGDGTGALHLNRVEGDGFNSNSGLNVYQTNGALALSVEDNLVYNIFGEDLDNDGKTDIVMTANGSEDVNGNGKLDIGEDLDGDGVIDVNEDNDKDGTLSDDDIGIGINIVADSNGAVIAANDPANRLHVVRNKTHLAEAEYFRQQGATIDTSTTPDTVTNVTNTFTARDINGDVRLTATGVVSDSDTDDDVGNKNGINILARDGGAIAVFLDENDTSFNNPYAPGLMPPVKNPYLANPPAPLGNEFGLRTAAVGVNSVLVLGSPNNHLSNSNFGHGYLIEAVNNASVTMTTPMGGSFTTDPLTGDVLTTTPSQFNDNWLNGLRVYGDQNSTLALQIGDPSSIFDPIIVDPDDPTSRTYLPLNQFNRNGQDGLTTTAGNGIEIVLRSGANFAAGSNSGIYNGDITDNADNGVLIDVADAGTNIDNFSIVNSVMSGNVANGLYISAENVPISNLRLLSSTYSNNGLNGINYQLLNSNLNDPFMQNNIISGNGNLMAVNPVSQFDIEVVFLGGLTATQQAIFQSAANRWAEIIIGDVPDVGLIDDVQITAEGVAIDGVNGVLGQAGPTGLRNGSNIPFQGIMEFDSADLAALEASGQLEDVILHEMGHVLGIGTIWNQLGLLQNPSNGDGVTDTRFTGALATAQYNTIFGTADAGVPVENDFGPGTADSHWRESILDNELMTGFLNTPGPNPISTITAGSLQDLGYVVNLNQADPYTDPTPLQSGNNPVNLGSINNDLGPFEFANATPNVVNLVTIDPNAMGNGINVSVQNSNINNLIIEDSFITNNTGDGFRMINPQFATNNPGDNSIHFRLNEITGNGSAGGYGINMALDNANHLDAVICQNNISNNTLGGINVVVNDNAVYRNGIVAGPDLADETSWFFGNTINDNGGPGYFIDANNNSEITLVGGLPTANVVNGNQDVGIGIEMSGTSTGAIRLDNTTINGTGDDDDGALTDTNTNFDGDGFGLVMTNNAVLNELRLGSQTEENTTMSGNRGSGIYIDLTDQTRIVDDADADTFGTIISNVTASNNGAGNAATVGDGISIVRRAESQFDDVWIRSSTLEGNNGDGIDIMAFGGANDFLNPGMNFVQDFLIGGPGVDDGNQINRNTTHGIDLLASSDVLLNVDILNNTIDSTVNGSGINANTQFFGILTGTWDGNTITNTDGNNNLDGISILAEDSQGGAGDPANVMVTISNNTIDGPGRDGIRVNSQTTDADNDDDVIVAINNNTITNAGVQGVNILGTLLGEVRVVQFNGNEIRLSGDDGLHIDAQDASDIRMNSAVGNLITQNGGDGVDIFRSGIGEIFIGELVGNDLADTATSGFVDNIVTFNAGNGYTIRNTQQGDTTVRIAGTDDPTANNGASATSIIANNGSNGIRAENNAETIHNFSNDLNVQLVRNSVIGNGRDGSLVDDERNGTIIMAGTSRFGITTADVRSNYLSGNQNIDFVTTTFIATPDPGGAGFTNNAFASLTNPDPLARFYLRFQDNQGDQLDVMRSATADASLTGYAQAYYDNADAFKSPERFYRGNGSQGTSRRRNAARTTLDLIDLDSGNVAAAPAPANNLIGTNLPNLGGTGNDYTNGVLGVNNYPLGARRGITGTSINTNNVTLNYAPNLGPLAVGTPFTVSWIDLAGVGESTLVLDDGGGAYDMAANGAVDGGNNFTMIISDFNDTGFIDPVGIVDSALIPFGGVTGDYNWRTINIPTVFDLQGVQVPGNPFAVPGADPFTAQPVIFP